jgi:hypothetical protein
MKRLLFIHLFAAFSILLSAQSYSRVRISLDQRSLSELAKLGLEADHGEVESGRALVTDLSTEEIALLKSAGFPFEILIEDVKKWYVVRAVSGQENKVKAYIENEINRLGMGDYISQVLVPTEKVVTVKDGKKIVKDKVRKPGHVVRLPL